MAKLELKHDVKLFEDEDSMGTQEVVIDTEDECGPWISVSHCGDGFSMSLENWNKLVELAEKVKSQMA